MDEQLDNLNEDPYPRIHWMFAVSVPNALLADRETGETKREQLRHGLIMYDRKATLAKGQPIPRVPPDEFEQRARRMLTEWVKERPLKDYPDAPFIVVEAPLNELRFVWEQRLIWMPFREEEA